MRFALKRHPLAERDAIDSALWYEERRRGLGEDFLDEVDQAVRALARDALLYRIRFAEVRRAPFDRFRYYGVYYVIRENEVGVLAIFHGRRHPRSLQGRVSQIG